MGKNEYHVIRDLALLVVFFLPNSCMPTTLSSLFPLQKVDIVRNQTVYDPQDRDTWPISGETVQGINTMGLSKEQ